MKRLILFIAFYNLINFSFSQCAEYATNACTTAAPSIIGNSINCDPPLNNAGRRNFRVTNMVANATYRVSNCGSGYDTQMTIRNSSGTAVDYNDDNGPACTGTAASIDFVPPADGDYRIQLNRYNCQSSGSLETGDITVTLIADAPPPLSNDDCTNAIPLIISETCSYSTYSNLGATDSGIGGPGCASYSGGDVWFSVEINSSGEVTIDSESNGITDSGMAVYSGSCGSLSLIECDDDGGTGLMSNIALTGRTPGEIIYIRFWEYGNDNQGSFGICATGPVPPTVTDVSICPGDPSQDLTASGSCTSGGSASTINGNLDIAGPYADTPPWFIVSTDPCSFDPTYNKNYDTFDFQVDSDGVYVFEIDPTLAPDFMGYIVINDPLDPFTYGSCATGTWIAGDDDSGPGLDAAITATLTAGVDYTLVTTLALSSSQSTPYTWTVMGVGSIVGSSVDVMEWYTMSSGGTAIATGANFDPIGVAGSGLTDTNTPGVYSYWAACSSTPDLRAQVDFVIGKVWNGTLGNTDWNSASNWIPDSVPSASDCLIIEDTGGNDPIINTSTDALGYNLTIVSGATLTQMSNSTLTITNEITVESGANYNMMDSSSLVQIDNVANTVDGSFTMQRNSTDIRLQDYVYWSSPVTSFNIEAISPLTPSSYLYKWNPSFDRGPSPPPNSVPNDYGRWELATGAMSVGSGYIVRGPNGYNSSTPSPFSTTFSGVPNNGDILNVPISRGIFDGLPPYSPTYIGPGSTQVTSSDDNWNLLGNPYPSAISARQFVIDNTNIDGTLYLWTHATQLANNPTNDPFYADYVYNYSDDYISYNLTGPLNPGDPGDLLIGAGQGFFVFMNDDPIDVTTNTNETVFFNNNMRNAAYANDVFYRNSSDSSDTDTVESHRIWIDLITPNNLGKTTLIGYVDGATNEDDRLYDGYAFSNTESTIYSVVEDKEMSIQGRALPFSDNDEVPLGLVIDEVGIYSIALNAVDGLFDNDSQDIYLEDSLTNMIHNLKQSPYTFSSEIGTFNSRFVLRYIDNSLGLNEYNPLIGIHIIEYNERLMIKSEFESIMQVDIFDVLGRTLYTNNNVDTNNLLIETLSPSKSALFLKIKLADGSLKVAKIIF